MSFFKVFFICFLVSSLSQAVLFNPKDIEDYDGTEESMPDNMAPGLTKSGLEQTLASQIINGTEGKDFEVEVDGRPYFLKYKMPPRTYRHKSRHLVVIVPGFGATNTDGAGAFLSDLIMRSKKQGYTTTDGSQFLILVTHSPAAPDFIEHSHSTGVPGDQRLDAMNLYQMIQASIEKFESSDWGYSINKVTIAGASLGSMNVSHMYDIDQQKKENGEEHIGFHQAFAINPPISNVYGSTAIDHMVQFSWDAGLANRVYAIAGAIDDFIFKKLDVNLFLRGNLDRVRDKVEEYNSDIAAKGFSPRELYYLVGYGFAPTVTDAIAAGKERGLIAKAFDPDILFTTYLNTFSLPNYVERKPGARTVLEGIAAQLGYGASNAHLAWTETDSVGALVKDWQSNNVDLTNYHLITWADDFLLRKSDPEWIQSKLSGGAKGNSQVYEKGGHLGGYTQQAFIDYFLGNLVK